MFGIRLLPIALAMFFAAASAGIGQIPRTISVQGLITDASGMPVSDGSHVLVCSIYDEPNGGAARYTESHTVAVVKGVANVILGNEGGLPVTLMFDRPYWLGIRVDGGAEMQPRLAFTAVPYALNSARAEFADSAIVATWAYQAGTALTADTADAIRGGVVRHVNGADGDIEVVGSGATSVSRLGNTISIRTEPVAEGVRIIENYDGSLVVDPPTGPFVTIHVRAGGIQTHHLRDRSITSEKLIDGVITADKLATSSVPSRAIADGAVSTIDLADSSITGVKVRGLSIDAAHLVNESVGTVKLVDAAVTTAKLLDQAVTADKLADRAVTTEKIDLNAVTTNRLRDYNVTLPKLDPDGADELQAITFRDSRIVWGNPSPGGPAGGDLVGSYPDPMIAPDAVTSAKVLDFAILADDIADDAVLSRTIGAGEVMNDDLADSSVTTNKISDDAVSTAKLQGQAVTRQKLHANSVSAPKMSTDGATQQWQALMFDGTNDTPVWSNAFVGSFAGNGSELDDLDAGALATGIVDDARLPDNLARLDRDNVFTGAVNSFVGAEASWIELESEPGDIGLRLLRGRTVLAYASVADGDTIPMDVNVIQIASNDATGKATVRLPANAENGQLIFAVCDDPHGCRVVGIAPHEEDTTAHDSETEEGGCSDSTHGSGKGRKVDSFLPHEEEEHDETHEPARVVPGGQGRTFVKTERGWLWIF